MSFDCIVAGSQLRYDAVRQRPHHVLERLAQRCPVLVVEERFGANADADEIGTDGAVTVLRPKRRDRGSSSIDDATVATVRAWVGERRPLVWMYQPMMLALAEAFPDAPVVFDYMDDLSSFAFAPRDLPAKQRALETRADLIFAGGRSLYEQRRVLGDRVRLHPSGVDVQHFASSTKIAAPQALRSLPAPVCTYVGAIDERIDFALVRELAAWGASVVLVGPVLKIDAAVLTRDPNVHFTGPVPYGDLPRWLAGTDVAIMPFTLGPATRSISPTKTPEYLCARRPVVSARIADVVADYGDVVAFADDPQSFAAACLEAFKRPDAARNERGFALARNIGWDAVVTRMWHDIEREIAST